jgi:3-(3-hydroxy-phenyl)propionate hydroxylase
LRDNLENFDTLSYELGWAVSDMTQHDTHIDLTLRHGLTGDTKSCTTAYLIGADGADSMVRRLADIALIDLQCDEPWLVVDWELDADIEFARNVYQFCDPKRPGTLVPCAGQHIRWEFMMNPDDDVVAMEAPDAVRKMMQPYLRHLGPNISPDQGQILRSKVYQFHALLASKMRQRRVFLMGDAAHQMPPFLGQGMCAGLRDAENLAWKLAGVLHGRFAPSLLDSYHSERYAHVRGVIKQAVQIGEIIQTRNPVKAFARDTYLRLGKLIPKLLSGIEFGQTWQLGDGLLADDQAAGRQIPQPWVRKSARHDRLDAFLPSGFCVLALQAQARATLQHVSDAHSALACPIICAGDDFTADATGLTALRGASDYAGFVLRPDRQIYATLNNGATPLAAQLDAHMTKLEAELLA